MTVDSFPDHVPELLPARMVNEFSYCARLFFLEWVQARFADNDDTVEGRWQHRVVDQVGGAAPLPDDGELRAARSVQLSSTDLGLVAKVDLIQGDDQQVRPVAYNSVVLLGDPAQRGESCFEFMGVHPELPRSGPTIV
jgi:hypothetical protein